MPNRFNIFKQLGAVAQLPGQLRRTRQSREKQRELEARLARVREQQPVEQATQIQTSPQFQQISTTPVTPTKTETVSGTISSEMTPRQEIASNIMDVLEGIIASGQQISSTITDAEIDTLAASLDLPKFLAQAELEIAPEYEQKYMLAKEDLSRTLSEIGEELGLQEAGIRREATEQLRTGRETLAGRGLALSGRRQRFERELEEEKQRQITQRQRQALQATGEAGRLAERRLGTEALQEFEVPQIAGRPAFQLEQQPIVGELQREREAMKGGIGRELRLQEAQRRAFTRRQIPT